MKKWIPILLTFLVSNACVLSRVDLEDQMPTKTVEPSSTAPASTIPSMPEEEQVQIPTEHQLLYANLEWNLERFSATLQERWDGTPGNTIFGAELLPANGNRGESLLHPTTLPTTRLYLDRLQEIGVGGVSIQISYPLLDRDFPRSDEYLSFFSIVAEEVRQRGMKLMVETGPVFPDPEFSNVQLDFSDLTPTRYFESKTEQILLIAIEIRPDYLSIANEPETEKSLLGLDYSVEQVLEFVGTTLELLPGKGDLLIGAGIGTWENRAYLDGFLLEPDLDFINLHIYPIQAGPVSLLERAMDYALNAKSQGKEVVIGEAWLYKVSSEERLRDTAYQEVYGLDVFRFWEPLDSRFIEVIVDLAHATDMEYVSFFWANYFFAYLDYNPVTSSSATLELYQQLNQEVYDHLRRGARTGTGDAYEALLSLADE